MSFTTNAPSLDYLRRRFMAALAGGLLCAPQFAKAQQGERIARVGFLYFGPSLSREEQESWGPFWPTMKDLGWVYGKNIVAERRYGETLEQLHAAAAELARLKVEIVLVRSVGLARIAKEENPGTPIVVGEAGVDLVAVGLAASLARPGGNVTGTQVLNDELTAKRLEFLKMLVPNLSKIAWLRDDVTWAAAPVTGTRYGELAAAAVRAQGVAPHFLVVHDPAELPAAFHEIRKNRNQALVVVNSPFMWENRKATLDLEFKHRLPAIYDLEQLVVDGGLISYGINVFEIYRRQAFYVDKILRGAKPGDLPIEQATKFELVINAKTAKALGLTIPAALLARANRVIE